MPRGKKRYTEEFKFDPSPEFAVKVNPDGSLDHSNAYDPKYVGYCEECKTRYPLKEGHEHDETEARSE